MKKDNIKFKILLIGPSGKATTIQEWGRHLYY